MPAKSVDTTQAERSKAPQKIEVRVGHFDERKELLDRLDRENPDFVHMYQRPDIYDVRSWELAAKHQEAVRDENGNLETHHGDPVVRVPREYWEARQKAEAKLSTDMLAGVVERRKMTAQRNPKQPYEKDSEE